MDTRTRKVWGDGKRGGDGGREEREGMGVTGEGGSERNTEEEGNRDTKR